MLHFLNKCRVNFKELTSLSHRNLGFSRFFWIFWLKSFWPYSSTEWLKLPEIRARMQCQHRPCQNKPVGGHTLPHTGGYWELGCVWLFHSYVVLKNCCIHDAQPSVKQLLFVLCCDLHALASWRPLLLFCRLWAAHCRKIQLKKG